MESMQSLVNNNGHLLDLSYPQIMGILNITPDSFSDGGKFNLEENALLQTEKMLEEGASIIDIGAQSTNPKAIKISAEEEISRLGNIISLIKKEFPSAILSLDTFYSQVAKFGYHEGIDWINDISGGQFDQNMYETVGRYQLVYILMHSNPSYQIMHNKKEYQDIIFSLNYYFSEKINQLLKAGVKDIILDPGFGFGKTIEDQHKIIDELEYINFGKSPVLAGISRKSFIYKPLHKTPLDIIEETQQLHLKLLQHGATILRVHDVKETKATLDLFLHS